MTWNYRVMRRENTYAIYEVYYDNDGNMETFSEEPVCPMGESLEELRQDLEHYERALAQPTLDYTELAQQLAQSRHQDQ
jgi:hypothetical protein